MKNCPRKAPLSGYEGKYDPDAYNKHKGIQEANNCYAYAFGYRKLPKYSGCTLESCPIGYPQPGKRSNYPDWSKVKGKRCPDLVSRFMGDVPGIIPVSFSTKCPKGTRKIAAVTDPDQDYHFYRQYGADDENPQHNGYWAHKPGATQVTKRDALGQRIYDPQLAARDNPESELDYERFCGYYCIPVDLASKRLKRGGVRRTKRRHCRKR
jgi:hypothetical protein